MNDQFSRKEINEQYKQRQIIGGVFLYRNTENGKILIDASVDLRGSINRFAFAQSTGSCVNFKLQKDWIEMGAKAFLFEVLEELEKSEDQTDKAFKEDIKALKELWQEKISHDACY
ncbi:MAG: GIY-YIG nuclease family protein [Eubacteriales bacterium]|nr:GIY-YIG nuclease family protein [Eubacteriales bacterium]